MSLSVAEFDHRLSLLDAMGFRNLVSATVDSMNDSDRVIGVASVSGSRIVAAEAGSVVSAADGAVVLSRPGSHVVAWSGARVFAADGATVLIGSGAAAHIDGDSSVIAAGDSGLEYSMRSDATIVSATGGARVDATQCDVYARDISLVVRHAVTVALLGPSAVTKEDARGSFVRRGEAEFDVIIAAIQETAALHCAQKQRTVWPAFPLDGQTFEQWLEPVRQLCRESRKALDLDALGWLSTNDRRLVIAEMCKVMALPPTIHSYHLPF